MSRLLETFAIALNLKLKGEIDPATSLYKTYIYFAELLSREGWGSNPKITRRARNAPRYMNTTENGNPDGAEPQALAEVSSAATVVHTAALPEHAGSAPAVLAGLGAPELPLWPTCADGSLSLVEELRAFDRFGKTCACTTIDSLTDL